MILACELYSTLIRDHNTPADLADTIMNSQAPTSDLRSLGDEACRLIMLYWPALHLFFETHLRRRIPDQSIDFWANPHILQEPFTALRCEITKAEAKDPLEIRKGISRWRDEYLWPLALKLGLQERVEKTVLENCWRRGHFKRTADRQRLVQPPQEEKEAILLHVRNIFSRFYSRKGKANYIDALTAGEHPICRDKVTAETVGREYKRIGQRAAGLAQGAILAFIKHRELGILQHALYPGADELLLLQGYYDEIAAHTAHPDATLADLRADVIAIRFVLIAVNLTPSLWQQDLLHWPRHSPERQQYQQRLTSELTTRIIGDMAAYRHCAPTQAQQSMHAVVQGGLPDLIDWRCLSGDLSIQLSTEQRRLRRILARQLGALDPVWQRDIEEVVEYLRAAMEEAKVVFSLRWLLSDVPHSHKRRRFSKKIWFGVASTQMRHQRNNGRRRSLLQAPAKTILIEPDLGGEVVRGFAPEDLLVRRFAQRAAQTEPEARDVIRNLGIYGGLGVVLKSDWRSAVDDRLVEYIELVRQGRVDGTVPIGALRERVNTYARSLGIPDLSMQLIRSCHAPFASSTVDLATSLVTHTDEILP